LHVLGRQHVGIQEGQDVMKSDEILGVEQVFVLVLGFVSGDFILAVDDFGVGFGRLCLILFFRLDEKEEV